MTDHKPCTCHPDDNPPRPCPRKYALGECRQAHLDRLLASLKECTAWMETLRASGDAGFWDWGPDDEYTRAMKLIGELEK